MAKTIPPKDTTPKPGYWHSKRDIVADIGCSATTVDKWTLRQDFPGGREGPWNIKEVKAYLDSTSSPYGGGIAGGNGHQDNSAATKIYATSKALKLREEHRRIKMLNDIREGLLVYRDDVVQDAVVMLTYLKAELERMAEDVSLDMPKKDRAKVKERFAKRIAQSLKRMSMWEPNIDIRRRPKGPLPKA